MNEEKEYYMNLHVGGKFVRDPYVRYVGDIYVEHEVDTPFIVDDILQITAAERAAKGANEGATEGAAEGVAGCTAERVVERVTENVVDAAGLDDIGDVAEHEGLDCDRGGVDDSASWDGGVQDVVAEGESGIDANGGGGGGEGVEEFENTNEDDEESDSESDSEEQSADSMDVPYLSDDEGDNELKSAREKNKGKKHVDEGNDSGFIGNDIDFHDEGVDERGNNGVTEDVGKNDTDYYDSDDHGSLIMLDDEEHEEGARRRGRYPIYNSNTESPHFCLGMILIDGKQFKAAINKYSRCSRRELRIIHSETNRISYKCNASKSCPWRIYVIVEHFEDTIRDHPKMKLKEIQKRVQSEIHINVNLSKCRWAKNMVTSRLGGNMKEEFANLWDYADELRSKNPGSTIKMTINRVSDNSPPHFKRFYVCFNAMKRGWKEGCRPIIGVDDCFLKGPFKGILLYAVGRDGNDQMYPIAWAVVEGESTYSWFGF
ncbi:hypothetical protein F3Y22_tig00112738pilonHSYRG01150 [Hibiscus syriacus]|uniref:Transposase MuDR plant domain-containing protein n=1 Tax=Hibiscus syriacus TaxID=106335 RepID=A0A6A2Y0K4_HIBSY|nr:hypothetical protein F3Y22_tig00112738pilonHSYRG01150 [Hibiscus syriacus]